MSFNKDNEEELKVVFSGSYEDTPENRVVVIEEGIEEIAENAFRDFEHLEEIILPRSLKILRMRHRVTRN